nr:helix-turn-helix transcriptional regulator [uncultured Microbacterium sp.]
MGSPGRGGASVPARSGITLATIGKIERGERKVTVGESRALSRALGLYEDELVRGISGATAGALRQRLGVLREELKSALHAFETGQYIVESQAHGLDSRDQHWLRPDVIESIEDVVADYRRDQVAANAARDHRARLDGLARMKPSRSEAFTPEPGKPERVGRLNSRALELFFDLQTSASADG